MFNPNILVTKLEDRLYKGVLISGKMQYEMYIDILEREGRVTSIDFWKGKPQSDSQNLQCIWDGKETYYIYKRNRPTRTDIHIILLENIGNYYKKYHKWNIDSFYQLTPDGLYKDGDKSCSKW